ncbi:hypothetical protein EVAR_29665_1 [Eumeta japonica]|uniref:Uncharacterized protein n=1 Tax=Eumeta variegata TaxID=151549 RepID=A0A4C1W973_EUMVA|nr:hypothetical protein EVAR_29665_1 [Eumeta japonica]
MRAGAVIYNIRLTRFRPQLLPRGHRVSSLIFHTSTDNAVDHDPALVSALAIDSGSDFDSYYHIKIVPTNYMDRSCRRPSKARALRYGAMWHYATAAMCADRNVPWRADTTSGGKIGYRNLYIHRDEDVVLPPARYAGRERLRRDAPKLKDSGIALSGRASGHFTALPMLTQRLCGDVAIYHYFSPSGRPPGKGNRGRTRWEDEIKKTAGPKWKEVAQDRETNGHRWRRPIPTMEFPIDIDEK